ncbi:uncharacterized protein LOC115885926 [Sitophilus oryzae]|uniref:Uncharacterized protein LOC115885926 n=2 Tax=Sitophilus oryzae TaxID=7048 RepID=A0A6J2YD49_SITOR|nr:uncharacterized protein LOC115885926 [Sitophilus oryzae]
MVNTRNKRYSQGEGGQRAGPLRNRPNPQPVEGVSMAGDAAPRSTLTQTQEIGHPPSSSAEPDTPVPTEDGTNPTVRRKKWTNAENSEIMRLYYKVTNLETDFTMYRGKLYAQFIKVFPNLKHLSEQRIADQRRTIVSRNLLSQETLARIKEQIRLEINPETTIDIPPQPPQSESIREAETETALPTEITLPTEQTQLDYLYESNLIKFYGSNPNLRPSLPKIKYTAQTTTIIERVNAILCDKLKTSFNLEEIHVHIYCAALTCLTQNGQDVAQRPKENKKPIPPWEKRMSDKISRLRRDIGRMQQLSKGNDSETLLKKISEDITTRFRQLSGQTQKDFVIDTLDSLKQQLAVHTDKLKRYKRSHLRRMHNAQFTQNERCFYRNLGNKANKENPQHPNAIDSNQLNQYWNNIWSSQGEHQINAAWINQEREKHQNVRMEDTIITLRDVESAIKKLPNWRSPGHDGIHNFWLKKFSATYNHLAREFTETLIDPNKMPVFLTEGITHLLPKTKNPDNPSQYRPITCLPSIYRIFSSCISSKIYTYLVTNNILHEEQKGCKSRAMGSKEQLVMDSVVL